MGYTPIWQFFKKYAYVHSQCTCKPRATFISVFMIWDCLYFSLISYTSFLSGIPKADKNKVPPKSRVQLCCYQHKRGEINGSGGIKLFGTWVRFVLRGRSHDAEWGFAQEVLPLSSYRLPRGSCVPCEHYFCCCYFHTLCFSVLRGRKLPIKTHIICTITTGQNNLFLNQNPLLCTLMIFLWCL